MPIGRAISGSGSSARRWATASGWSARPIALIRVISPDGAHTLFGIDRQSHYIRYMGFVTPRGFHERHYDDFVRLPSGWVQAREVTLFYNGVKANTVFWQEVKVGEPIDPGLFAPPSR